MAQGIRDPRRGAPAGRREPPEDLNRRLRSAGGAELRRLVDDWSSLFGLGELRAVLRNPHLSGDVIEELAANRRLTVAYEARAAIARQRRTPQPVAMRFVSGLYWRDLMEISRDVRLHAPLRRLAETYLLQRLDRLATGERLALARRAPAETASRLLHDPSLRVVAAVLGNSLLREEAVVAAARDENATPQRLDVLARDERFGRRYDVRSALCRNPQTPFRVLFDLLPTLRCEDLLAISALERHAQLIRGRAETLAEERCGTKVGRPLRRDSRPADESGR